MIVSAITFLVVWLLWGMWMARLAWKFESLDVAFQKARSEAPWYARLGLLLTLPWIAIAAHLRRRFPSA